MHWMIRRVGIMSTFRPIDFSPVLSVPRMPCQSTSPSRMHSGSLGGSGQIRV
jgi:hypothetical protein